MTDAGPPLALIVPTVHHRADLFDRTLRYLDECGCPAPIVVSDHSPPGVQDAIAAVVRRYSGLDLRLLQHPPEMHFLQRLVSCAQQVDTPYVHLHADDDFLVPTAIGPLLQVMEEQPGCAAVMGINIHLGRTTAVTGRGEIVQAQPFDRLLAQMEAYSSVLYALRRREEFIATLTFAASRCPDVQFWQYLESCVAALRGGICVIDELHYVRSTHPRKWSATLVTERSPDHFPWLLLSPEFRPRLQSFRAALVECCREAGAAVDDDALDHGLVSLLAHGVTAMGLPGGRYGRKVWNARREAHERAFAAKAADAADPMASVLGHILRLLKEHAEAGQPGAAVSGSSGPGPGRSAG